LKQELRRCPNCGAFLREEADRFVCDYCGTVTYPTGAVVTAVSVLGPVATGNEAVDSALARNALLGLSEIARRFGLAKEAARAEKMALAIAPDPGVLRGLPEAEMYVLRLDGGAITLRRTYLSAVEEFPGLYLARSGPVEAWVQAHRNYATASDSNRDYYMHLLEGAKQEGEFALREAFGAQVGPLLPETGVRLAGMALDLGDYLYEHYHLLLRGGKSRFEFRMGNPVQVILLVLVAFFVLACFTIAVCFIIRLAGAFATGQPLGQ